ncbi:hypothetical protein BTM36_03835 [Herbaspirillum sp. VT-16-41]|nr:hypothetical protein BTM36_03835 [Herbaspirillum sp. VT-16-41]
MHIPFIVIFQSLKRHVSFERLLSIVVKFSRLDETLMHHRGMRFVTIPYPGLINRQTKISAVEFEMKLQLTRGVNHGQQPEGIATARRPMLP